MKSFRVIRRLHLWFGLILAVQVFLWMASGVVMSVFDIELVRGERNALSGPAPELEASNYASPGGVIAQADGATSLILKTLLGRSVYQVDAAGGQALFDAKTAQRISPISEATALDVAQRDFIGDGRVGRAELLSEAPREYRRALPVWRVTFTDDLATRIYVSPQTGEIEARRNKIWRLYDFFWMLHIMDYEGRENFNNPLLKTVSITALLFAATGIYLVVALLLQGKYRISVGKQNGQESKAASGVFRQSAEEESRLE
jgi:uncharacterized iron-regulated membrane protein